MNDHDYAVILRSRLLERRMLAMNMNVTLSEEDVLLENSLSSYLSALFRVWTKQAERVYETMCDEPSSDKPPETPPDSTSGPVPV